MQRWYAACCKTNQEERAEENLGRQAYEVYNPSFVIDKVVMGETINIKEPIFPGYIFIKFNPLVQSAKIINNSFGVRRLITFGDALIPMDDVVIDTLKARFNDRKDPMSIFLPKNGTVVEIKDGIFAGIRAIFLEPDGAKRSILMIKLLGAEQRIQVSNSSISA